MEIDFISREVVLNFNSESYIINQHRPIYVKLEYRGSVFKVTDYKKKLNSLSFALPEKDLAILDENSDFFGVEYFMQ